MGDEYTERKIRVYDVKKKDSNKVVKAAVFLPKTFYHWAVGDEKKARVSA